MIKGILFLIGLIGFISIIIGVCVERFHEAWFGEEYFYFIDRWHILLGSVIFIILLIIGVC